MRRKEEMQNFIRKMPFIILDLLQKKANEEHPLQQKDVQKILAEKYDIKCNRKTVGAGVEVLRELGYEIAYHKGYYLTNKTFGDEELRFLIDSVLFSKNLTKSQAERLLRKIKGLGDEYFQQELPAVAMFPKGIGWSESKNFMKSVLILHKAIAKKVKISFAYMKYGTDLKRHPTGSRHVVSPYHLVAANGYYFLMCNYDGYDDMVNIRVDRMKDIETTEERVTSPEQIKNFLRTKDLPKHLAEHIYMFNGPSSEIKIKTTVDKMSDLVDWFGKDIKVENVQEQEVEVNVHCNEQSMFYWLLQYGMYVEVLEPLSLRQKMREAANLLCEKYKYDYESDSQPEGELEEPDMENRLTDEE